MYLSLCNSCKANNRMSLEDIPFTDCLVSSGSWFVWYTAAGFSVVIFGCCLKVENVRFSLGETSSSAKRFN